MTFPTKEFPYQSHIQTKLHLKISRWNLLKNILLVTKSLNKLSPPVFSFSSDHHNYETSSSNRYGNL